MRPSPCLTAKIATPCVIELPGPPSFGPLQLSLSTTMSVEMEVNHAEGEALHDRTDRREAKRGREDAGLGDDDRPGQQEDRSV